MREANLNPLNEQVAVVTGAGRGIGAAIARKLAALGAVVILCGRKREPLESTAAEIGEAGGRAEVLPCDVTDLSSVEAAARYIDKTHACADIVVNNAGIGGFGGPFDEMLPESWDAVLNTNLRGVYYCIRSFAPMMVRAKNGHIINISSLAGKNPLPNGAAYAASKLGLEWAELFGGRGAARAQYSGFSCLSWISGYRAEPACGKRFQENAATGRCGSRCWDAGDAGAAVVCQRDFAAADDEAMRFVQEALIS